MQLRRKQKEGAEVFTDSLNDIMFFLLLFFIILSTMANRNAIKLNLPSSKKVEQITTGKPVLLSVDANHNYFVNNLPITIDQMEPVLLAETKAKKTTNVMLVMDKSLSIQDLADVMQIGSRLGLKMVISAKSDK